MKKEILHKLYEEEKKSIRQIANELGCHPDTVHYWLKKHMIKTRSKTRKSQLQKIPLDEIKRKINEFGIRGYARKIGISEGTIRHHLKVREKEKMRN